MTLGIKKIRKILGEEAIKHSDEELLAVEQSLRLLARIAVKDYLKTAIEQRIEK